MVRAEPVRVDDFKIGFRLLAKHWDTEKYFFATFEMVEIGLKHHNNCVREKARGIIKFMYRVNDEKTRDMFDIIIQNDRDKQIRDKTVQNIHDDFDKIDGKPTKKVCYICQIKLSRILSGIRSKTETGRSC